MTLRLKELTIEALKLDERSRASLALILLESLGAPIASDVDSDRLVLEEAERRDRELANGAVRGRPWEDVLEAARADLGSRC